MITIQKSIRGALLLTAACLLTVAHPATTQAAPIDTLFNTGVDAGGAVLTDGTLGDPHYALTSVPGGTTDIRVRRSSGGFPIGPWIGDNTLSAWIGPNNANDLTGPVGSYTYETTFDLTGLDPATAVLTGQWSTDNPGTGIFINSTSVGSGQLSGGFSSFTPFTIDATTLPPGAFLQGINTLSFVVSNAGGPTGLRVEVTGTADLFPIPEPGAATLAALGGVAFAMRRRPVV